MVFGLETVTKTLKVLMRVAAVAAVLGFMISGPVQIPVSAEQTGRENTAAAEGSEAVLPFDEAIDNFYQNSESITDEQIRELNRIPDCCAFRMYRIAWGSFRHVEAILALMIRALLKEDVGYLHLLTGEDYPLFLVSMLDAAFLGNEHIYMDYILPQDLPPEVTVRFRTRNILVNANIKNKLLWQLQHQAGKWQEEKGKLRDGIGGFDAGSIYKGLVYCSMPREAAAYVLRFVSRTDPSFWEDLKTCQVPEEFFFQTIFMNSREWKDKVKNRQLRYMDWSKGNGSSPAYLTEADYSAVVKARKDGYCFARKFHPVRSKTLREKLKNELVHVHGRI
jgi:hypothetical protein